MLPLAKPNLHTEKLRNIYFWCKLWRSTRISCCAFTVPHMC